MGGQYFGGPTIPETLEQANEKQNKESEYKKKGEIYKTNPEQAIQEKKNINESLYGTKKSPDEFKKAKLIVKKVKELESLDSSIGKTKDEIYEEAEKIINKQLKENQSKKDSLIKTNKSSHNKNYSENKSLKTWNEALEEPTSAEDATPYNYEEKDIPENNEKEKSISEQYNEIDNGLLEKPQSKIINRLNLSDEIKEKSEIILKNNLEFNKKNIKKLFSSLDNSTNEKKQNNLKQVNDLFNYSAKIPKDRESIPKTNIENFKKDFKELADLAENGIESITYNKMSKKPDQFELKSYELISENYIKIGNTPEDKKANFNTAIELAATTIMKNGIDIDKNSETYKKAIINIHSKNTKQKLKGLNSLVEMEHKAKIETAKKFIKTYPPKAKKPKEGTKNYKIIRKKLNNSKFPILTKLSKKVKEGFEIFGNTNERFNNILENIKDTLKQQTISQKEINEKISEIIKEGNGAIKEN